MNYDYSPFNPLIWGLFIIAWAVIWVIGNVYRKNHRFTENETDNE